MSDTNPTPRHLVTSKQNAGLGQIHTGLKILGWVTPACPFKSGPRHHSSKIESLKIARNLRQTWVSGLLENSSSNHFEALSSFGSSAQRSGRIPMILIQRHQSDTKFGLRNSELGAFDHLTTTDTCAVQLSDSAPQNSTPKSTASTGLGRLIIEHIQDGIRGKTWQDSTAGGSASIEEFYLGTSARIRTRWLCGRGVSGSRTSFRAQHDSTENK